LTVVEHHAVVFALNTVWHPLLSKIMRAVPGPGVSVGIWAVELGSEVVELAERKTVVLPFGSSAVTLTRIGIWWNVRLCEGLVEFSPAMERRNDMGRMGNADEDVALGHTVVTGTWITVVGKT
jgi:hypothetical protein